MAKTNILRSADKMPEADFAFKPVESVRTYGQLLAHIADSNYGICGAARGEKPTVSGIEKSKTTKADIVAALNDSFTWCDQAYSGLTDEKALEMIPFFRGQHTRAGVLMFNTMHDYEHYGNLVTYMRMKGIVPPSSERSPQQKKQ